MRIRSLILPLVSLAGVVFAGATAHELMQKETESRPTSGAVTTAAPRNLAGAGIVEPSSELVGVAAFVSGVVVEVSVAPGADVKSGDVLFRIDARALEAARAVSEAKVAQAAARLDLLLAKPRAEDVPPAEARAQEMTHWLGDEQDRLQRAEALVKDGAGNEREATTARFAVEIRKSQLEQARADLALIKAGASAAEIAVACSDLEQSKSDLASIGTQLDLLVVRAPLDSTVLQVNVRRGEFVQAAAAVPPVILGTIQPLHVRVDLDENDASRYVPGAPARAFLRGFDAAEGGLDLEFVRIEPLVIPKRVLTGATTERVDTRVLQVIYRIASRPAGMRVYCGQQADVMVQGGPPN